MRWRIAAINSLIFGADWCTVIKADYNDDVLLHSAE